MTLCERVLSTKTINGTFRRATNVGIVPKDTDESAWKLHDNYFYISSILFWFIIVFCFLYIIVFNWNVTEGIRIIVYYPTFMQFSLLYFRFLQLFQLVSIQFTFQYHTWNRWPNCQFLRYLSFPQCSKFDSVLLSEIYYLNITYFMFQSWF